MLKTITKNKRAMTLLFSALLSAENILNLSTIFIWRK